MTYRVKPYGGEIVIPNTTGTATSLSEATAVRLVNPSATNYVVNVVETQSGSGIGSFTLRGNSELVLEKKATHCVYVNTGTAVLGTKVGFTN